MNTNPLRTSSVTIPIGSIANPGSAVVMIPGEVFICVQTTSPFKMQFDSRGVFDCIAGAVIPVTGGYKGMTFFNETATPIVVIFGCGANGISFIPTNTFKVAPTYTKGTDLKGPAVLNAGIQKSFSGFDGLQLRKQITVQNMDAGANACEVQDAAGNCLAVLAAGSPPWTLETSGQIIVKNTSVATISRIIIGEIFYS